MVNQSSSYIMDVWIAWTIRGLLFAGFLGILLSFAGCSSDKDGPRSQAVDLSVKGSYIPGPGASTRNQIPQGGTDEKSDSTPVEPAK